MRKLIAGLVIAAPVLAAAALLAGELANPPPSRTRVTSPGSAGDVEVQGRLRLRLVSPAALGTVQKIELAAGDGASRTAVELEACVNGACARRRAEIEPGRRVSIPVQGAAGAPVDIGIEAPGAGGPVALRGHGGAPDFWLVGHPSWRAALTRAREQAATFGVDLFWPALAAWALALTAILAVAAHGAGNRQGGEEDRR